MRDLTEEELKLAPDWATHYTKGGNQVTFFNELKVQSLLDGELDDVVYDNNYGIESGDVQIPSKPFDITKHEFSDYSVCVDYLDGADKDYLVVETSVKMPVILNKSDAIAIAKAFGVTGEDLK